MTKPVLATKTIKAINDALELDQGRKFRGLLRTTMPLAEDAYDDKPDAGYRTHLGASIIGRDCPRELWYSFHWATRARHQGRILRLFNRGHLEEPRFVALLRMINYEVWQFDETGKQFRISAFDGHFGGSLDCVLRGCLDYEPTLPILGEFKTHGEKSYEKLVKDGVRISKFEHYIQQQIYMGGYNLPASLYLAVNKNTDDIYGEIITFDLEQYTKFYERAGKIINATEPPPKISENPGWYKCRFCEHRPLCHLSAPSVYNCRTCAFSQVIKLDWNCQLHHMKLTKEKQIEGCSSYTSIPKM
jgi:hypothetical protein